VKEKKEKKRKEMRWKIREKRKETIFTIFLWYCNLNSGPIPWATLPALFCCKIGSRELFSLAGFKQILLISAFWVIQITGIKSLAPCYTPNFICIFFICLDLGDFSLCFILALLKLTVKSFPREVSYCFNMLRFLIAISWSWKC
jgi:hypothetical protein